MCGIIGVTGSFDASEVLLGALEVLEYRGYDSAGVAFVDEPDGALVVERQAERATSIAKLRAEAADTPRAGHAAIGHTRWATHGAPTVTNAHPHVDCSGTI